jgi:predicted membrane protein
LVLLLIPLTGVSASGVDLTSGVGDRRYVPTGVEDVDEGYQLVVGAMELDLTDLQLDGEAVPIEISMAAGELVVIVPDDVAVAVEGTVRAGEYSIFDQTASGTGLQLAEQQDGADELGRIDLDIDVLVGEVTVQAVARD